MRNLQVIALISALLLSVSALQSMEHLQFDSLPTDDCGNYQWQEPCPEGWNIAGEYCVKCDEPSHWNPVLQKCFTCDPNEPWNNETHQCECCPEPRSVQGGKCVCPSPKTEWNANTETCNCPPETYG